MQQVHGGPGVPGRLDEMGDRDVLRPPRPGGEEIGVPSARRGRCSFDRGRVLDLLGVQWGNSSTPDGVMKHLKPKTPASCNASP